MVDFNPVAHVKNAIAEWHASDRKMVIGADISEMVDYIDALRAALHDAQQYVDKVADEWDHAPAEVLAHTIRHLLDD